MSFTWNNWLKRVWARGAKATPLAGRRTKPRRPALFRPGVEALETRLAPAFDLTIGTGAASVGVTEDAAGNITAIAHGAFLNVGDIRLALTSGLNVTVSDGNTGTETGNITWQAGADLSINGLGVGNRKLTVAVDPSATFGSVTLGAQILDTNLATPDALNVNVSATRDLTVNGNIQVGLGSITLAADTKPDGTGDDGVGTFSIGPGAVVNGGAVTLRGAAVNIDTSATPASVTANTQSVVIASGLNSPEDLVFDSLGNLFVTNQTGNSISKITPAGQVSTFFSPSAMLGLNALAIDGQNNLFVTDTMNGRVYEITPQANPTLIASGFSQPDGIALDVAGNVYVANFNTGVINKISGGQTTVFASGFNSPAGIAFDAAGNLYVNNVGNNTINKVSPDGKTITTFANGLSAPSRLVFDSLGNLYVTNAANGVISKVTPRGQVSTLLTGFNNPHGLRFDSQGNLFVASFSGGTVSRVGTGTLTIRSSLPGRPITVGGSGSAAGGINLTNAELARLSANDVTFGDNSQVGNITFTTASLTSSVEAHTSPTGVGTVILDDGNGAAPALLAGGTGTVLLVAGEGGILAVNGQDNVAEIATAGVVELNTIGPIGSAVNRVQFDAETAPFLVSVSDTGPTAGVYLDGLGNLVLGAVTAGSGGTIDVTARSHLTVAAGFPITAAVISLAADTQFDGTGDNGVGTLTLNAGVKVNGITVTLRGADVNIDASANPASVIANRVVVPTFAQVGVAPATLAFDAAGNLYVANAASNTVSKVTPQGQVSTFAVNFNGSYALAFDAHGNLFVGNLGNNTLSKVTPDGTVSTFVTGIASPYGLAFDAAGNLYVSNDLVGTAGGITKVTPQGQTSTFATGFNRPAGLTFDAQGNLYADIQGSGTVLKITPDGKTVKTFATGLDNPYALAFDPQGNLYVTSVAPGAVIKITPQGVQSTFATGFNGPDGLAFDAAGNLFVANFNIASVGKIDIGTVTVRSSLPTRPVAVGGADNAVAGVNLTAAQLARITAADVLTFGDPTQTGNITLFSVTTTAPLVQVVQNPAGPGSIILDETAGTGLVTTNGSARFIDGTGGIHETNFSLTSLGVDAGTGSLSFNGGGDVGTLARGLNVNAARLVPGFLAGALFLADPGSISTVGPVVARSIFLTLGGDFTTHAGDLNAGSTELLFDSQNVTQHLDSGGQGFSNVMTEGISVTLQLVNSPLSVAGNFIVNVTFNANNLPVTVAGLTADFFTYLAGSALQTFLGGLMVDGTFQGGTGPVTAGGIVIDPGATFVAPSTTLTDTGDFTNQGKTFNPNGGSVVLAGANQHVNGSTTFHNLTKVVTTTDTLTLQANTTQTVTGFLTLQGAIGQPLLLRSSVPGQIWAFAPQGRLTLFNLDVRDGTDPFLSGGNAVDTVLSVAEPADVAVQADVALGTSGVQYSGLVARYSGPGEANLYWGALVGNNGQFFADIFRNVGGVWTQLAGAPVATGTGSLRFEVVGSSLKLYLNDALAASATDTMLTAAGTVGVRSSPGSGIADFAATALPRTNVTLPFNDAFTQPDGSQLSSSWLNRLGSFQVKNNQLVADVADPTAADANSLLALATLNGLNAADVTVRSDLMLGTMGTTYGGVVARSSGTGDQNMYWGGVVGVNGTFSAVLYVNVNGTWSLLASKAVSGGSGTLTLAVVGTSLKLSFGATTLTATDSQLTSGTVGLRGGPGTIFDNFSAA